MIKSGYDYNSKPQTINIKMSCGSCRKQERDYLQNHYCKFRTMDEMCHARGIACEEWLPSKTSVRIWIERHFMTD